MGGKKDKQKDPSSNTSRTGHNILIPAVPPCFAIASALLQDAITSLALNAGVTLQNTLKLYSSIWLHPQWSICRSASLPGSQLPGLSVSASTDLISISTVCGLLWSCAYCTTTCRSRQHFLTKKLPQINKQALFVKLVTKNTRAYARLGSKQKWEGVGLFNYRG